MKYIHREDIRYIYRHWILLILWITAREVSLLIASIYYYLYNICPILYIIYGYITIYYYDNNSICVSICMD